MDEWATLLAVIDIASLWIDLRAKLECLHMGLTPPLMPIVTCTLLVLMLGVSGLALGKCNLELYV